VAVLYPKEDRFLPWSHTKTDEKGEYTLSLPPGNYQFISYKEGYPYASPPCSSTLLIELKEFPSKEPFLLPDLCLGIPGTIKVYVWDHRRIPLSVRILLFGEGNPPVLYTEGGKVTFQGTSTALPLYPFFSPFLDPLPRPPQGITLTTIPLPQGGYFPATYPITAGFYTGEDGFATTYLPPGEYFLIATKGPRYGVALTSFTLSAGENKEILVRIAPVRDPSGYLMGDLHVHSFMSPDSPLPIEDRILSSIGEEIEFFASTDHEFITDYRPYINRLSLPKKLLSLPGEELTTFDFGHFNAFPLQVDPIPLQNKTDPLPKEKWDAQTVNGGAVGWFDEERGKNLPPHQVMTKLKNRGEGEPFRQINHPHNNDFMGYWEQIDLTFDFSRGYNPPTIPAERSGMIPGPKGKRPETLRLSPDDPLITDAWEGIEIGNGSYNPEFVWKNLNDLFAFLNLGKTPIPTFTSDSHNRFSPPIGNYRTLVYTGSPVEKSSPEQVLKGLKEGKVLLTTAPFLEVTATIFAVTQDSSLYGPISPGGYLFPETIVRAKERSEPYSASLSLYISLISPPWAPVEKIEVFRNAPYQKTPTLDRTGTFLSSVTTCSFSIPYTLEPATIKENGVTVPTGEIRQFFSGVCTIFFDSTTNPIEESWILVRAYGSSPLYPIVLGDKGTPVLPIAITSPLYIDLDGDGRLDGPCSQENSLHPLCRP
jgi:hypothetical protein